MSTETQLILEKLDVIKEELDFIKDHMVDVDTVLTDKEKQLLEESYEHERKGELTSLEDLRNELGQ